MKTIPEALVLLLQSLSCDEANQVWLWLNHADDTTEQLIKVIADSHSNVSTKIIINTNREIVEQGKKLLNNEV